jgi:HK97 family phage major capsid protein
MTAMQVETAKAFAAKITDQAKGAIYGDDRDIQEVRSLLGQFLDQVTTWATTKSQEARADGREHLHADDQRQVDKVRAYVGDAKAAVGEMLAMDAAKKAGRERVTGGNRPEGTKDRALQLPSMRQYDEQKALRIGSDPDGGYLTETETGPFTKYLAAKSIALKIGSRVIPMASNRMELPKLTASATVYTVGEEGTVTASSPTFGRVALTAYAYAVRVLGSVEWFDDANPAPRQLLTDDIRDRLALKFDIDCLEGDGTSTKPIVGVRHMAGITQTEVAVGVGNGGAIALADVVNAIDRLRRDNAEPNFIAMHPRTWGSVQQLVDGQSRPMLQPDPTQDAALRLFGIPVYLSSQISITETQGSNIDCSYVLVGDAQQLAVGVRTQNQVIYNPFSYASTRQVEVVQFSRLAFNVINTEAVEIIEGVRAV